MIAQPSTYYDGIHQTSLANFEAQSWIRERNSSVAPLVIGDSVLDIGCGLGLMSELIGGREYLGIDFSRQAIIWAMVNTSNKQARFRVLDAFQTNLSRQYDTVLLLEILEHVRHPDKLVKIALAHCSQRLVATVPRDMPGPAHVHPRWTKRALKDLLGLGTYCWQFGGEYDDRWWMAVKDLKGDQQR